MTYDITVEHDALRCWTILSEAGDRQLVYADELANRMPDPEGFREAVLEASRSGGVEAGGLLIGAANAAFEEITDEAIALADKAAWAVTVEVRNAYVTPDRIMARHQVILARMLESRGIEATR